MNSLVFMGVAGCGKSSVAQSVAAALGWAMVEGDSFHPPANSAKMRAGIALSDEDRAGWLDALGAQLASYRLADRPVALTCSSLKRSYREQLRAQSPGLRFVFLDIDRATSLARVQSRAGVHLFPASLVDSQFSALESPVGEPGVLRVDATAALGDVTVQVVAWVSGNAVVAEVTA